MRPADGDEANLGAVVVAHATVEHARGCVASLRRVLPPDRVVLVVNVPAAVDANALQELKAEANVVSPAMPQGYGANLNFGVAHLPAGLDAAILANDDLVFDDESPAVLAAALRLDGRLAVVGPRLVNDDGADAVSVGRLPTATEALRDAAVLPGPLWRAEQRAGGSRRAQRMFVVGAAFAVRLEAFTAVGGFDEDFFLNWEEADFCDRVQRAGWTVGQEPTAVVRHLQGGSISRELNFASFYSSLRLFYRKRLGPVRWPLFELLLVIVFTASAVYVAVASALRPRSARARFAQLGQRWRTRIFLRRSQPPRRLQPTR